MKNELLLSAAILPMCGMAGEAIAASPAKGAPKEKQRPNIILFLVDDMGWQDTSLPSGLNERITTTLTTRRTWNAWQHKGRCSHKHTLVVSAPPPGSVFLQG